MKAFLVRRWFLLALVTVMSVGLFFSDDLLPLASQVTLRYGVVATVLFLMALPLEARMMWRTIRRPAAPLLAVAMNWIVLPLLVWLLVATVGRSWLGGDLSLGLLVVASTPCTLASAAVWTRRAGGNDAVSIMVTVITNASCFLVTPFWLLQMTGKEAKIDASQMILKLALVVVLPMVLAQLIRLARAAGRWATRNKTPLGVLAQIGILTMILFGSVQTGQRFGSGRSSPGVDQLLVLLASIAMIHLGILMAGMAVARVLGMERPERIAVGLAGSQKTLMVGLQVCMELGFNIIPMVAYHVSQLLIDTIVADRLRRRAEPGGSALPSGPRERDVSQT